MSTCVPKLVLRTALVADGRPGWKVTDQLAFNLLLDRNIIPIHVRLPPSSRDIFRQFSSVQTAHLDQIAAYWACNSEFCCHQQFYMTFSSRCNSDTACFVTQAPKEDPRVIWTYGDKLRLKPLPVLVAANGHVYFYQHLPEKCGLAPTYCCLASLSNALRALILRCP